jgi:hypothetical protein
MLTLAPTSAILRTRFDKTRARTRRLCGRRMIFAGRAACFLIVTHGMLAKDKILPGTSRPASSTACGSNSPVASIQMSRTR